MNGVTRNDALETLSWLLEAGADEAILDMPLDRLAVGPSARGEPPVPIASRPLTTGQIPRASQIPSTPNSSLAGSRQATPKPDGADTLAAHQGAARALAASCATLAELKTALENFDGGELKRGATKTVFADGAASAKIMLIGEAPGRDEDSLGIPFVGRAGKLLDRMLATIGLDRSKVYITNLLPWRPPQNRDPSPEEAVSCLPFLQRHIELIHPEILILLGAVSARHVLGATEGIMRLRGKWDVYQTIAGQHTRAIPTMPTLHPAYLLRQPAAKRLAWRDLCAIQEKIEQLGLA